MKEKPEVKQRDNKKKSWLKIFGTISMSAIMVFALSFVLFPQTAHASFLDVLEGIWKFIKAIMSIIIPSFAQDNIVDVYNMMNATSTLSTRVLELVSKGWFVNTTGVQSLIDVIKNFAYALTVLYFLIDLIGQVIALDKVTVESIIRMLVKLLLARILISQAPQICQAIYETFHKLYKVISDVSTGPGGGIALFNKGTGADQIPPIGVEIMMGNIGNGFLSAVQKMFSLLLSIPLISFVISLFVMLVVLANGLIMNIIASIMMLMQSITLYTRFIEIGILTVLSPIAMAGVVSPEFKGITKKFLLSFAALCLQGVIIYLGCKIIIGLGPGTADTTLSSGGNLKNAAEISANAMLGIPLIIGSLMQLIMMTTLIGKSRQFANAVIQG